MSAVKDLLRDVQRATAPSAREKDDENKLVSVPFALSAHSQKRLQLLKEISPSDTSTQQARQ